MMSLRQAISRPADEPDSLESAAASITRGAPPLLPVENINAQLAGVLNASIDGLLIIGDSGTIHAFNPAAARMFGYDPGEVIGRDVRMLAAEASRPADIVEEAVNAQPGWPRARREGIGRRKDGSVFPVELSISEISLDGRRMFLAIVRDITSRKQAEREKEERFIAELTRSNAELARFAYIASHDLQEPLRMIASYLDLLSNRYSDKLDTDAQEFIAFAVDGAARMKRLIADLLEYSRVGGNALQIAPVNAATVVAEIVRSLGLLIQEAGADVRLGDLPVLAADEHQLRRIFQNLIENAIKYRSDAPPVIGINASRTVEGWRFDVTDNGIGVDPRFRNKVFDVFTRLHSRARYPGSGIGLAVARLAVERHGGSIWVEPVESGGSRFSFVIPLVEG